MRWHPVHALAVMTAIVSVVAGCGDDEDGGGSSRRSKFDVGSAISYCLSQQQPLAGVTVNLTDVDGDIETTTTSSNGLWTIEDVKQGIYTAEYLLAGYRTELQSVVVAPDQVAGSDVTFVEAGSPCLSEIPATVTIAPFGITLENGEFLLDGINGVNADYSKSSGVDIVLTFDRPFIFAAGFGGSPMRIIDGNTFQQVNPTLSGGNTIYTFSAAQLQAVNAGAGLTSNGAISLHRLDFAGPQYTPINGSLYNWGGQLKFDAIP